MVAILEQTTALPCAALLHLLILQDPNEYMIVQENKYATSALK
jgi:hypothetical protein